MQANQYRIVPTSLGFVGLIASPKGLKAVLGPHEDRASVDRERESAAIQVTEQDESAVLDHWAGVLQRYADSGEVDLSGPLDMDAGTDFQRAVWQALTQIPAGTVHTYGDVARAIGRPKAARAVGQAVGANPLGIVVP